MHYLIKLIVEGENRQEALENAQTYGEALVEQGEFDWFTLTGRWGQSVPHRVTSKKGKALIDEGMLGSRREFDRALTHARYMLDHYTADEIYEEDFGTDEQLEKIRKENNNISYLSRYMFGKVDGVGNSNYVYADGNIWGGAIQNQRALNHVLDEKKKLWVVPVDMHN
jgi:hypothetical protein